MSELLRVQRDGAVATVWIDRQAKMTVLNKGAEAPLEKRSPKFTGR